MKTTLTLFAVLILSALSFGSTDCQSTFHVGSGQTAITFCVTANGNIAYFSAGLPQIQDGAEGYALCNGAGADAWDLGLYGDSGNWLPSVITQPGGPDTFPLTISRWTADGWKTITQAFSALAGGKGVHVKMTITGAQNVYRFAHVQLTQQPQQYGDHSANSSFIWSSGGYGLMASPALTPRVGAALVLGGPPADGCSLSGITNLPYAGDSALLLYWTAGYNRKSSVSFDYVPMR